MRATTHVRNLHPLLICLCTRSHGKALLVSFDSENNEQAHSDALTREVQGIFK